MVIVKKLRWWKGVPLVLLSHAVDAAEDEIVQADVASLALEVFNLDTGVQILTTIVPVVSSTIFDTLQLDYGWDEDTEGYNFRYELAGTYFPTADILERIEVLATPTSGTGRRPIGVWEVQVESLLSN